MYVETALSTADPVFSRSHRGGAAAKKGGVEGVQSCKTQEMAMQGGCLAVSVTNDKCPPSEPPQSRNVRLQTLRGETSARRRRDSTALRDTAVQCNNLARLTLPAGASHN